MAMRPHRGRHRETSRWATGHIKIHPSAVSWVGVYVYVHAGKLSSIHLRPVASASPHTTAAPPNYWSPEEWLLSGLDWRRRDRWSNLCSGISAGAHYWLMLRGSIVSFLCIICIVILHNWWKQVQMSTLRQHLFFFRVAWEEDLLLAVITMQIPLCERVFVLFPEEKKLLFIVSILSIFSTCPFQFQSHSMQQR